MEFVRRITLRSSALHYVLSFQPKGEIFHITPAYHSGISLRLGDNLFQYLKNLTVVFRRAALTRYWRSQPFAGKASSLRVVRSPSLRFGDNLFQYLKNLTVVFRGLPRLLFLLRITDQRA